MSDGRLSVAQFRAELLDLLARSVPFAEVGDEAPDVGVPTAVLVVLEWQASDGKRWLARDACLGSGQDAPDWTDRMLAQEALDWDLGDDDGGDEGDE